MSCSTKCDMLARAAFARVDAIATDVFAVELPPLDGDVSALSSTPLPE